MPIPVNGVNYSKLCRKILGRGWGTGFSNFIMFNRNIEDEYVEVLSLTHGAQGKRWHIWICTASVIGPTLVTCQYTSVHVHTVVLHGHTRPLGTSAATIFVIQIPMVR